MYQEASGASSLSAERRIENQPLRESGAWQNSCEKGMKFFADGERDGIGPRPRDWGRVSYRTLRKIKMPVARLGSSCCRRKEKCSYKSTNSENIKLDIKIAAGNIKRDKT